MVKRFLGGLKNLGEFLSEYEEWHSFVIGWGDGVAFTRTDWWAIREIEGEPHYYKFGVGVGRITFFVVLAVLVRLVVC